MSLGQYQLDAVLRTRVKEARGDSFTGGIIVRGQPIVEPIARHNDLQESGKAHPVSSLGRFCRPPVVGRALSSSHSCVLAQGDKGKSRFFQKKCDASRPPRRERGQVLVDTPLALPAGFAYGTIRATPPLLRGRPAGSQSWWASGRADPAGASGLPRQVAPGGTDPLRTRPGPRGHRWWPVSGPRGR